MYHASIGKSAYYTGFLGLEDDAPSPLQHTPGIAEDYPCRDLKLAMNASLDHTFGISISRSTLVLPQMEPSKNRAQRLLYYLGDVMVNGPSTPLATDIPPGLNMTRLSSVNWCRASRLSNRSPFIFGCCYHHFNPLPSNPVPSNLLPSNPLSSTPNSSQDHAHRSLDRRLSSSAFSDGASNARRRASQWKRISTHAAAARTEKRVRRERSGGFCPRRSRYASSSHHRHHISRRPPISPRNSRQNVSLDYSVPCLGPRERREACLFLSTTEFKFRRGL